MDKNKARKRKTGLSLILLLAGLNGCSGFIWTKSEDNTASKDRENLQKHIQATADKRGYELNDKHEGFNAYVPITDHPFRDIFPKISPDGKKISFARIDRVNNDVWIFDIENWSEKRVILKNKSNKMSFLNSKVGFSHGGVWGNEPGTLLITASKGGNTDIYLYDINAESFKRITKHKTWDGSPSLSPNNKYLAFVSGRSGNGDIWLIRKGFFFNSRPVQLTKNAGLDFAPVWSQDSKRVFYTSKRFENFDIYALDIDDKIPIRLTNLGASDKYVSIDPTNQDRIAFFSDSNIGYMDLKGINFKGLPIKVDVDGWRYKELPSAEIKKRVVMLIPEIQKEQKLFLDMPGKRQARKQLSVKALPAMDGPAWSPDGKRILFISDKSMKPIYAIDGFLNDNFDQLVIYEVKTETKIHSDLSLSKTGYDAVFSSFIDPISKHRNNINILRLNFLEKFHE